MPGWLRRRYPGVLVTALSAGVVIAVAVVALVALGHRAGTGTGGGRHVSPLAALEAKLAVLRRPQTAADRTFPAVLAAGPARRNLARRLAPELTRLATTVTVPGTGRVRVYVTVIARLLPRGSAAVAAVAVDVHGQIVGGARPLYAGDLASPAENMPVDPALPAPK